jgi:hypothetical protein
MTAASRLNGTSDIAWESIKHNGKSVMEYFPDMQFYDYTKSPSRMMRFLNNEMPANYHLTFSKSETNYEDCRKVLRNGGNIAVVFQNKLPSHYMGHLVVAGDDSDVRFIDPENVVVGLTAKGKARKDESGFSVIAKLEKYHLIHTTPLKFTMRKNGIQQLTSV